MSAPAQVLLTNIRLVKEGKVYRRGSRKAAAAMDRTRVLAGLLIGFKAA